MKKRCIFASTEGGEGPFYCGHAGDLKERATGLGHIVMGEIDDLLTGSRDEADVSFEVREMTDEEIAAIPEV
jgi:hypothetical protein